MTASSSGSHLLHLRGPKAVAAGSNEESRATPIAALQRSVSSCLRSSSFIGVARRRPHSTAACFGVDGLRLRGPTGPLRAIAQGCVSAGADRRRRSRRARRQGMRCTCARRLRGGAHIRGNRYRRSRRACNHRQHIHVHRARHGPPHSWLAQSASSVVRPRRAPAACGGLRRPSGRFEFPALELLQALLDRGTIACLAIIEIVHKRREPLAVLAVLPQLVKRPAHAPKAFGFDLYRA